MTQVEWRPTRVLAASAICVIHFLLLLLPATQAQYRDYTDKYKEVMLGEENLLTQDMYDANPELNEFFNPESALLKADEFVFSYPTTEEYNINIIVDPCRGHKRYYDCCMNVFGTPEYAALKVAGHTQERVVRYAVLGNESAVNINYNLVYEDGGAIPASATRTPDDDEVHDYDCESPGVPYAYCAGKNYAFVRSKLTPACMDNNQSMNTLNSCTTPDGEEQPNCVAVAYSQNAFIGQCKGDDPHCGTFLEVHQVEGTPYSLETDVISDVRVTKRQVSGFYTTTLPMTWKGNPNKLLCAYSESFIRVGSIVYISRNVPVCCCAKPFKPATRVGSVQCPTGAGGGGAFGFKQKSLAQYLAVDQLFSSYPFCFNDLTSKEDSMLCSIEDKKERRFYIRACPEVKQTDVTVWRTWTSSDLDGKEYDGLCPYYDSCALTLDDGKCKGDDLPYTFMGRVGKVTFVDDISLIPKVRVTFNNGRTSYLFNKDQVVKEYSLSMYEIWWVLRTKSEFVVQKRKGFNITNPRCTFDIVNNRYFPYTLIKDGVQQDSATSLD